MNQDSTAPNTVTFYTDTQKNNQNYPERVRISRLQNGVGWEVETYNLERALELWRKLENEFGENEGWGQKKK